MDKTNEAAIRALLPSPPAADPHAAGGADGAAKAPQQRDAITRAADGALADAAERGDLAEIERQLAAGADPNAREGSRQPTPLQLAARKGHATAIAALATAGGRVNSAMYDGVTALMLAAWNGRTAAVDALLDAGADVHHVNDWGNTALIDGCRRGHLDAARVLLIAGARADVRDAQGKLPIDVVRARCVAVCARDVALRTVVRHCMQCAGV